MGPEIFFVALLCVLALGGICTLVGFITIAGWIVNRLNQDPTFIYLDGRTRGPLVALLQSIRYAPDPLQALEASIAEVAQRGRLPGATTPVPAAPPVPSHPIALATPDEAKTAATLPDMPVAMAEALPTAPPLPVVAPVAAPPASVGRWLALDTITLLLYLGAALVVIAAGVFVASSWDAIGGLTRWATVAVGTLGFLGTGELFVRRSTKLERAGETFRGLGMVLLPFVALAYDRFVLDGDAPPAFWAASGAALALLYYAFYRWSNPGRLTAYLAPLSAGIFALMLPEVLGLGSAWQPVALLLLSGALMAVAWRMEPNGAGIVGRLTARTVSPLVESHLLVGGLTLLGSLAAIGEALEGAGVLFVYALLLTGLLLALAFWLRGAGLLALALLASGWAVYQGTDLLVGASPYRDLFGVLAWQGLALALFALPHRLHPWLAEQRKLLDGAVAWWAIAAFLMAAGSITDASLTGAVAALEPGLLLAVAALVSGALFVALAARYRTIIPLWPALVLLHLAVLGLLSLVSSETPSALLPTLIWVALAALWLGGDYRPPVAWSQRFWAAAFVIEALWLSFFALAERPTAALAGVLLTGGWLWLARRKQAEGGIGAALAQGVYALFALFALLNMPAALLPLAVIAVAVALVGVAPRLPAYAQRPTEWAGLLLALLAPLSHLVGSLWDAPALAAVAVGTTAQLALGVAALLYGWQATRRAWLVLPTTILTYLFAAWLTLDYVPQALAPVVILALGAATQAIAPRAPGPSGRWLEPLGLLVVLLAPLVAFVQDSYGSRLAPVMGLNAALIGQSVLLLAAALYALRGWQRQARPSIAVAGSLLYLLYAWVALTSGATAMQLYTVPLAGLILSFGWLFPTHRTMLEWFSAFMLLVPAALQMAVESGLLYSLLLGAWALVLLALGITLSRRTLVLAGSAGLLLAALRQIWGVLSTLPPGIIVGIVGLTIMIGATLLALFRDSLMQRLERLRDEG